MIDGFETARFSSNTPFSSVNFCGLEVSENLVSPYSLTFYPLTQRSDLQIFVESALSIEKIGEEGLEMRRLKLVYSQPDRRLKPRSKSLSKTGKISLLSLIDLLLCKKFSFNDFPLLK